MRTQAGSGWGCLPGCWADDGGCDGPGLGGSPGDRTGLAAGLLYDLFRVLRVRVHVPLLGPLLDLLFWITLTAVLFVCPSGPGGDGAAVWSGIFVLRRLRLFLAAQFRCALGGLPFGRSGHFVLKILVLPLIALNQLRKKIKKLAKNIFLSGAKWGRINQITQEMERSARPPAGT